jgi:hypothetical protein
MRCRIARPDVPALGAPRVICARTSAAVLASCCRSGSRAAAEPRITRSRVSAASSRRRVRLGVIARRFSPPPNQSAGCGQPEGKRRTTGPIPATSVRAIVRRTCATPVDRASLLRFVPLQHIPAALRCPGLPATGQSRFGVCRRRPRDADSETAPSPLRSFALRRLLRRGSRGG